MGICSKREGKFPTSSQKSAKRKPDAGGTMKIKTTSD
jgi:hypothetical protein